MRAITLTKLTDKEVEAIRAYTEERSKSRYFTLSTSRQEFAEPEKHLPGIIKAEVLINYSAKQYKTGEREEVIKGLMDLLTEITLGKI